MQSQNQPIDKLYAHSRQSIVKFLNPAESANFSTCSRFFCGDLQTEKDWFESVAIENADQFHPGLLARLRNPLSPKHLNLAQIETFIRRPALNFKIRFMFCLYRLKVSLGLHQAVEIERSLAYLRLITPRRQLHDIACLIIAQENADPEQLSKVFSNLFAKGTGGVVFDKIEILSLLNPRSISIVKANVLPLLSPQSQMPYRNALIITQMISCSADEKQWVQAEYRKPKGRPCHTFTKHPLSRSDTLHHLTLIHETKEIADLSQFVHLAIHLTPQDFFSEFSLLQEKIIAEFANFPFTNSSFQHAIPKLELYLKKHLPHHPEKFDLIVNLLAALLPLISTHPDELGVVFKLFFLLPPEWINRHKAQFIYPLFDHLSTPYLLSFYLVSLPDDDQAAVAYRRSCLARLSHVESSIREKSKLLQILFSSFSLLSSPEKQCCLSFLLESNDYPNSYLSHLTEVDQAEAFIAITNKLELIAAANNPHTWNRPLAYLITRLGYTLPAARLNDYFDQLFTQGMSNNEQVTLANLTAIYAQGSYEVVAQHHDLLMKDLSQAGPITIERYASIVRSLKLIIPFTQLYEQKFSQPNLIPDALAVMIEWLSPNRNGYYQPVGNAIATTIPSIYHLLTPSQKDHVIKNLLGIHSAGGQLFNAGIAPEIAAQVLCDIADNETCNQHFMTLLLEGNGGNFQSERETILNCWFEHLTPETFAMVLARVSNAEVNASVAPSP